MQLSGFSAVAVVDHRGSAFPLLGFGKFSGWPGTRRLHISADIQTQCVLSNSSKKLSSVSVFVCFCILHYISRVIANRDPQRREMRAPDVSAVHIHTLFVSSFKGRRPYRQIKINLTTTAYEKAFPPQACRSQIPLLIKITRWVTWRACSGHWVALWKIARLCKTAESVVSCVVRPTANEITVRVGSALVSCGFRTTVALLCKSLHWKWQKKVFPKGFVTFYPVVPRLYVNKPFVGEHGKAKRFCCQEWWNLVVVWIESAGPRWPRTHTHTRAVGVSRDWLSALDRWAWGVSFALQFCLCCFHGSPTYVKHMLLFILLCSAKEGGRDSLCLEKKYYGVFFNDRPISMPFFWPFFILLKICFLNVFKLCLITHKWPILKIYSNLF